MYECYFLYHILNYFFGLKYSPLLCINLSSFNCIVWNVVRDLNNNLTFPKKKKNLTYHQIMMNDYWKLCANEKQKQLSSFYIQQSNQPTHLRFWFSSMALSRLRHPLISHSIRILSSSTRSISRYHSLKSCYAIMIIFFFLNICKVLILIWFSLTLLEIT